MESKLAAPAAESPPEGVFPYANWGPAVALLGVVLALGVGIVLSVPTILADSPGDGDLSTWASVVIQLGTALGFLLVPVAIAMRWGSGSLRDGLGRLGVRKFKPLTALVWMVTAIFAYFVFAIFYVVFFGEPRQEDIAESFGPVGVQILLIVILASLSEELCFRGMLFGGLRRRLPRVAAALISAAVFGLLHAPTGITAVPPLIAFAFILALLYEQTGSVVPGIVLHMLNNSLALVAQ